MKIAELKKAGYEQKGYWFIKDNISVNFMSDTIRCTNPKFDLVLNRESISIKKLKNLSDSISALL